MSMIGGPPTASYPHAWIPLVLLRVEYSFNSNQHKILPTASLCLGI